MKKLLKLDNSLIVKKTTIYEQNKSYSFSKIKKINVYDKKTIEF